MTKLMTWLRQADKWGDRYIIVLLIALAGLLLRVPSFFEPIWYGDEAIYLTIGHAMNNGAVLYKDIVDHKTPFIYYLAKVDSLTYMRLLTGIGMVVATVCFFFLSQFLFKSKKLSYVATTAFMLLTTLPWLEGPMANGELWVLIFVIPALLILTKIESIKAYFQSEHKLIGSKDKNEIYRLVIAGLLFGMALMTKVPALFDIAAGFLLLFLPFLSLSLDGFKNKNWSQLLKKLRPLFKQYLWLTMGILLPFTLSLLIFTFNQGLSDYIRYGLLYNFHYAGTWQPHFGSFLLAMWFSMAGKFITLLLLLLAGLFLVKRHNMTVGFVTLWFGLDLFASLLSNRPYPHYLLQLVPTLVLLLILLFQTLAQLMKNKHKFSTENRSVLGVILASLLWLIVSLNVIQFYFYPSLPYFTKFLAKITGQISYDQYAESFNQNVKDNTTIVSFLHQNKVTNLYIWGSNPLLYAQGKFLPSTQLITLFHVDDLKAHSETLAQLQKNPPPYIVVMKSSPLTYAPFATWLNTNYIPNHQFDQAVLWKHISNPRVLGSSSLPKGK